MKQYFLLPHAYKNLGWVLFVPFLLLGVAALFFEVEFGWLSTQVVSVLPDQLFTQHWFQMKKVNITVTVAGVGFIVACLLVGFSAEKLEDEFVAKVRLQSLQWAVLVNYMVLITCFLLVYDMAFLQIMIYNMFTVLLFYILRFHFVLYLQPIIRKNHA